MTGDQLDEEPDDAGDEDGVPTDLLELHEVLEWKRAAGELVEPPEPS